MTRIVTVFWTVALLATSWLVLPATARAQSRGGPARTHVKDSPCAGCLASFPEGATPVPLIVALHGDHESPRPVHDAWEKHAAKRGVAVLALACPSRLGCKGSYWQWNGDPSWIDEQIAKLAEVRPIDRERLWLAGWSGGASYAGYRTQQLERTFAALVIHGGGMPPGEPECSETHASLYFLVGDANPLHALAGRLRKHYDACGNDVVWDLVRGADHPAEWKALTSHGDAILDWLSTKHRAPVTSAPSPSPSSPSSPSPLPSPRSENDAAAVAPAAPPYRSMPPRACGCDLASVVEVGTSAHLLALMLVLGVVVRRRNMSRTHRAPLIVALCIGTAACSRASSAPPSQRPLADSSPSSTVLSAEASAPTASTTPSASAAKEVEPPAPLRCIVRHYVGSPQHDRADDRWYLALPAGTRIPYDDGRAKIASERLASPDLEDTFAIPYTRGAIRAIAVEDHDPGRVRNEALFQATYGKNADEVSAALVPVTLRGHTVRVHRKVLEPFRRAAARLDQAVTADPALGKFFRTLGGTFNWRPIAGTDRTSAHGWGIAIDLDVSLSHYWRNDSGTITWKNRMPQAIVDAFEAEGFVWGGRWYHYDTMHFEYRPEILDPACYPSPPAPPR